MDYYFLGEEELVTAFRFIGIQGMAIKNEKEAQEAFRRITEDAHCQVLILTEETSDWLGDLVTDWQLSGHYPLLVEIPGISGKQHDRKT